MTDRPMIFSDPMVKALIAGRKFQTRRLLNTFRTFAPESGHPVTLKGDDAARALLEADDFLNLEGDSWTWTAKAFAHQAPATRTHWYAHLPYAIGDRLWVKEAIYYGVDGANWYFEADHKGIGLKGFAAVRHFKRLKAPAMFLPRVASRIMLTVTEVRVERLHHISNEDCIAEGVEEHPNEHAPRTGPAIDDFARQHGLISHYGAEYKRIWDSIHGKKSWAENPIVIVPTFTVTHANIDTMSEAA